MNQILTFGDSNTWGLIPGTKQRYPWGVRWTSVLQEKERCKNVRIIEEGLCGRTTVFEDAVRCGRKGIDTLPLLLDSHQPLKAVAIMLGTNDCKALYNVSADYIANGIERCIKIILQKAPDARILLISPILLGENVWRPDKDPEFDRQSVITSRKLKEQFRLVAEKLGIDFLAASDFVSASEVDDEHMTAEGHKVLADVVYNKLIEMKVI